VIPVEFYVDGACAGNHGQSSLRRAGAGIVGVGPRYCRTWSVPLPEASTNNQAELLAVLYALSYVRRPEQCDVTIYTDSAYAEGVCSGAKQPTANAAIVARIRELAGQCGAFAIRRVRGHAGDPLNVKADKLARAACKVAPRFP
jgi:ribonuclease HI